MNSLSKNRARSLTAAHYMRGDEIDEWSGQRTERQGFT
jgi:hypothetical protein